MRAVSPIPKRAVRKSRYQECFYYMSAVGAIPIDMQGLFLISGCKGNIIPLYFYVIFRQFSVFFRQNGEKTQKNSNSLLPPL